jgi:hypothetical protein
MLHLGPLVSEREIADGSRINLWVLSHLIFIVSAQTYGFLCGEDTDLDIGNGTRFHNQFETPVHADVRRTAPPAARRMLRPKRLNSNDRKRSGRNELFNFG